MENEHAAKNTEREIWRGKSRAEFGDDDRFYADSLFIPASEVEALGINCGGMVIVKPIREWHRLAASGGPTSEASVACTCANSPLNSWPNLPHDKSCALYAPLAKAGEFNARAFVGQFHAERVGGDYDPELILRCLPGRDVQIKLAERAYAAGQAASGMHDCKTLGERMGDGAPAKLLQRIENILGRCVFDQPDSLTYDEGIETVRKLVAAPAVEQMELSKEQVKQAHGDLDYLASVDWPAVTESLNALLRSKAAAGGKGTEKEGEK